MVDARGAEAKSAAGGGSECEKAEAAAALAHWRRRAACSGGRMHGTVSVSADMDISGFTGQCEGWKCVGALSQHGYGCRQFRFVFARFTQHLE